MASYRLTALLILVIALLCVTPALAFAVQQVSDLGKFNEIIKKNSNVMVFFHAVGDEKSVFMSEHFDFHAEMNAAKVVSIKVDIAVATDIVSQAGVPYKPAFYLYQGGKIRYQIFGNNLKGFILTFDLIAH